MDGLPKKLLLDIAAHLPTVRDILRFKQVNKRLHSIVSELRLESVVVSHGILPLKRRWFHTYQPITSHVLKTLDYSVVPYNSSILSGLKQLQIISTDYTNFESYNLTQLFGQIASLSRLEHLELICVMMKTSNPVELDSTGLHTLSIDRVEFTQITLNTPNLKFLKLDLFESYNDKIIFSYPQSVRLLITKFYEKSITSLRNLEYLYVCQKIPLKDIQGEEVPGKLDSLFLNRLPSLKELQFYEEDRTYDHLAEQRRLLKRDTLLFFCGVELVDNDLELLPKTDWSPYTSLSHTVIEFYAHHYRRTASILPFARRMIYDDIGHCLGKLQHGLMNKFVNLRSIEVSRPLGDVSVFVEFLRNFQGLRSLLVEKTNLNQQFFDELPQLQPVLDQLEIYGGPDLDFGFVLRFKDLNFLFIDRGLNIDLVFLIFQKFGDMRFFFNFMNKEIMLKATGQRFEISVDHHQPVKFSDLNKMFDYFTEIDLGGFGSQYPTIFDSESDEEDLDELMY